MSQAPRKKTKLTKREQSAAIIKTVHAVQGVKYYGKVELSFWGGNLQMINMNQSLLPDDVFADRSLMVVSLASDSNNETQDSGSPHQEDQPHQVQAGEPAKTSNG